MSPDNIQVKICGLRDLASARVAVESGADALGFILAPSRRQVSPAEIREIRGGLLGQFDAIPPMIGVVVNASTCQIASDIAASNVDMVQLAGDESPELLDEIDVPAIKALRFEVGTSCDSARTEIERWLDRVRPAKWILVEGHAPGAFGGTGTLADWEFVASISGGLPIWLAGGLDPDNVGEAISEAQPIGVDVSSGIETDGVKDHAKIRSFMTHARQSEF